MAHKRQSKVNLPETAEARRRGSLCVVLSGRCQLPPRWWRSASTPPSSPRTPPASYWARASWSPPPSCWRSTSARGSRPRWRSPGISGRSRPSPEPSLFCPRSLLPQDCLEPGCCWWSRPDVLRTCNENILQTALYNTFSANLGSISSLVPLKLGSSETAGPGYGKSQQAVEVKQEVRCSLRARTWNAVGSDLSKSD